MGSDPKFSDDELALIRDICISEANWQDAKGTTLSTRSARAYEDIGIKADDALKARASKETSHA